MNTFEKAGPPNRVPQPPELPDHLRRRSAMRTAADRARGGWEMK